MRTLAGLVCAFGGAALIVYGGILAGVFSGDGGQPDYLPGFALALVGMMLCALGMLLLGLAEIGS